MSRYHVNPETGRANLCQATVKCRFGLTQEQHHTTKEQARAAYEKTMKREEIPAPHEKSKVPAQPVERLRTKAEQRAIRENRVTVWLEEMKLGKFPDELYKIPFVMTDQELTEESREFEQETSYTVKEMLEYPYVKPGEIEESEERGEALVVGIPGSSEAYISTDLARHTLGMAPRPPSPWDNSPFRKIQVVVKTAQSETFGSFDTNESYSSAQEHHRKINAMYAEAKKLLKERFPSVWLPY